MTQLLSTYSASFDETRRAPRCYSSQQEVRYGARFVKTCGVFAETPRNARTLQFKLTGLPQLLYINLKNLATGEYRDAVRNSATIPKLIATAEKNKSSTAT